MLLRSAFVLLLSACISYAKAQIIIPRFEAIGVNEGLSQSSVYSILQDKFGYMWFGTADGLSRYDGSEIRVYKLYDSSFRETNFIRGNLCEDVNGAIWFCNEAGIFYYDPIADKLKIARTFSKKEFHGYGFEAVFIRNGVLWMLGGVKDVYSYDLHTGDMNKYSFAATKETLLPLPFSFDTEGNIWLSFNFNDGIYRFSTKDRAFTHFWQHLPYYTISFGRRKHFLLEANGRIQLYDSISKNQTDVSFIKPDGTLFTANYVFEDAFGRIWALSFVEGIAYYDPKLQKTFFLKHDNVKLKSLPINICRIHYIDRNNNLWIGTDGGGAAHLDLKPPKFNLFPMNDGDYPFLKDYFTKCFYEDKDKRIWFGTHNNGFCIYDPATGSVKNIATRNNESLACVGAFLKDRDGNVWVGHSLGIDLYDERTNRFTPIKLIPSVPLFKWSIYVYDLKQLQCGDVVAATSWGLLHCKKQNGVYVGKTYFGRSGYGSITTSVCETEKGNIWLGSPTEGLLHYTLKDSFQLREKFFEGLNFRSIHTDEQNKELL